MFCFMVYVRVMTAIGWPTLGSNSALEARRFFYGQLEAGGFFYGQLEGWGFLYGQLEGWGFFYG